MAIAVSLGVRRRRLAQDGWWTAGSNECCLARVDAAAQSLAQLGVAPRRQPALKYTVLHAFAVVFKQACYFVQTFGAGDVVGNNPQSFGIGRRCSMGRKVGHTNDLWSMIFLQRVGI